MLWFVYAVMAAALAILFFYGDSLNIGGMDSDQFGSLIFYGILLTVLGSGFLAGRQRLGTMAKQAMIWLALIVICVAGYEYRFELKTVASRVTAGVIPGAAVTTSSGNGTTVQIAKNGSHFQTDGEIDGRPVNFVVDTGASTIVLTYQTAEDIGLNPQNLTFNLPVATANGTTNAATVKLGTISIGGIDRTNITALVSDQGQLFENLLGMNFLDTLSGFDVRRDRLILRD